MHAYRLFLVLIPLLMMTPLEAHRVKRVEAHPLHLSHGNMVLAGRHAIINVRLFQDDLELAMGRFHSIDGLRVRPDPIIDSLFTDYFNSKFTVCIADSIHEGRVVASGQAGDMWWYAVVFEALEPITSIAFSNDLLFDIFDDQRNITRVLHTSSETQRTFYSVAADPETRVFSVH
ncbi:MAG: hypothetical protein JSW71_16745 [Gemmatimonadota bacterium]|nr:MAG: hypothetical protein JSW71_16745 [Gemmatimonadota bacterium]